MRKQEARLKYLDGIKALATVLVFNIHFFNAYYCGIYTLNPQQFHTEAGVERWIGATPLNIIYAGKAGARIFLAVSAFLLAYGYFQNPDRRKLLFSPVKKYIRLAPPVLLVNLLVCLLMRARAYHNGPAAALAGSGEYFGVYNQFEPRLWEAAREALAGCFVTGSNRYNGPIWFLQYEFLGCLLVALVLLLVGNRNDIVRYAVYGALALCLVRTDYLCMILSLVLADLVTAEKRQAAHNPVVRAARAVAGQRWLLWILLLSSLYFLTYPSFGQNAGTIYAWFPPKVLFYYNAAIPVLLFALFYLKPAQRLLEKKIFARFTSVSYFFYLVHFPLLATLSAAFFCAMYGKINYHALALLTYVLTFTASVLAAWLLTRYVDQPVRRAASALEEKWLCRK